MLQISMKNTFGPTIFEYSLSAISIYFLSANQETGGVSKVDVTRFCIVVDCSRVDQVLDGHDVLIAWLYIHIQTSDDPGTPLTVEQEQIVFGLCKAREDGPIFTVIVN